MRRKIKDSVIENLECVCTIFSGLSVLISFFISMFSLPNFLPGRDTGPFTRDIGIIAFIWFLISFICFFKCYVFEDFSDFLHERNDKIDEEEKAQLQAKAQAKADKETAEAQIWVNV